MPNYQRTYSRLESQLEAIARGGDEWHSEKFSFFHLLLYQTINLFTAWHWHQYRRAQMMLLSGPEGPLTGAHSHRSSIFSLSVKHHRFIFFFLLIRGRGKTNSSLYACHRRKTYLQRLAHATTNHHSFNTLLDDFFKVSWLHSWRMLSVREGK